MARPGNTKKRHERIIEGSGNPSHHYVGLVAGESGSADGDLKAAAVIELKLLLKLLRREEEEADGRLVLPSLG